MGGEAIPLATRACWGLARRHAGRTTLNGEGLKHEDGHSHIQAALIPNCVAYDPTYAYEVAVIVRDGLRRMCAEQEDVFYYLTLMNENYRHPPMPEGVEEGMLKGMYLLLRRFFEVDRRHLVLAAVRVLADEGAVDAAQVAAAIERYDIDTEAEPRGGGKGTSSSPTGTSPTYP